ncbi:DUF302 domain-containing protein [Maribacter sp. SA7]|uniref:DUF302 domain-containing protein n=1 Tax=Maribacter zhoushanensis TaxID=3030012 RepID=UPI0023EDEC9E|nr:DUF302 domain-containing protein [Maribacter zhoushanensis]MDF4202831.1 DUF302 domain-containing protein [Maribacter zhoushanensis]
MKSAIISKSINAPFTEVYETIRNNVLSSGFLLLHEIDTQNIVSKHGVVIKPLKQLLFFHPDYIQKITAQDILAINEIPIKVVVAEEDNGSINVSFPNPVLNLSEYNIEHSIAKELLERTLKIIDI